MTESSPGAYSGQQTPTSASSDFNAYRFMIKQVLAGMSICMPVQVLAVSGGGVAAPGFVDVQPMVNQITGARVAVPHGRLYRLPVFRLQGGGSAIILDPQIGDIGLAIVPDRDISSVIATRKVANPGSRRRFDLSDAMYFGGFINETPTQYIQFLDDGVTITSPNIVTINAPGLVVSGNITATGNITAGEGGGDQVTLQTHKHPTAATGSPSSPTPGT